MTELLTDGRECRTLVTTPTFGRFSDEPWLVLKAAGDVVRPYESQPLPPQELLARVSDVDALIVGMDAITAEVMDSAPRLRVIAKHGVGLDTIDIAAARLRGIRVTCAPGSNTRAVAELTFAVMLGAARKLGQSHVAIGAGSWPKVYGPELAGKTLGIIGFGRIGKLLAGYANAFGMQVMAYDPYLDGMQFTEQGVSAADFHECVTSADFVTLHLPAEHAASPLLDRATLRAMKHGAVLVNTSRGGLVDESALADLLHGGQLGGAAIDAFSTEPPTSSPLLDAPNTFLTPHLGACSYEANQNMGVMVAKDVARVLRGEEPQHEYW